MQVLVRLAPPGFALPTIGLVGYLVEHAVRVGNPGEIERKRSEPNRLRVCDVTPVNSRQKALAVGRRRGEHSVGHVHRSKR